MLSASPDPAAKRTGRLRALFLALALVVFGHNLASVILYRSVSQVPLIWGLTALLAGGAVFFLPGFLSLFVSRARPGAPASRRLAFLITPIAIGILFAASFIAGKTDIASDGYTAEGGALVLAYNLSRCFLIAAFIAICVGAGVLIEKAVSVVAQKRGQFHTREPDTITRFFVGAAALGIAMLFVGLAGGYHYWIVMAMVLPPYVWGVHHLCLACNRAADGWSRRMAALPTAARLGESIAWGLVLTMALFLLLLKGIFPANDDFDVWTHYLPFYRATVEAGVIAPNDVWYHYWTSKGATLFYMMMVISDLLAPQLVSYAMILMGCMVVYSLMRRLISDRTFSLLAVAAYLQIYLAATGWGHFFKSHEVLAGLVLGTLYLLMRSKGPFERAGLCILICYLALLYPTFSAVVVGGLGVATVWALITRKPRVQVLGLIGLGTVSTATVALLLAYNYHRTGLALETPVRLFWEHADREKFSRLYSPHLVDYTLSRVPEAKGALTFENLRGRNFAFFAKILRLQDLPLPSWMPPWVPGGAFVLALGALLARIHRVGARKKSLILALCTLIAISLLAAPVASQPISVYRVYGFLTFVPVLVLGSVFYILFILACRGVRRRAASGEENTMKRTRNPGAAKTVLAASVAIYLGTMSVEGIEKAFGRVREDDPRQRNLDTLIKYACGWHGPRWATKGAGLLDEDLLALRQAAGLREKVVNLSVSGSPESAYPGIGVVTEVSYAMGKHWHEIAYGDAETAMARLKHAGLNYFIIDFPNSLFGTLPFSPLFHPSNRWQHFNVAGQSGNRVLLTWKTKPGEIDETVMELWDLKLHGNFGEGLYDFPVEIREEIETNPQLLSAEKSGRHELLKQFARRKYREQLNRDFVFESNVHFVEAVLARFDEEVIGEDLARTGLRVEVLAQQAFAVAVAETWDHRYTRAGFVSNPTFRDAVLSDIQTPAIRRLYDVNKRIYREKEGQIPVTREPGIPIIKGRP